MERQVFGFERIPVMWIAVGLIFCLSVPALGAPVVLLQLALLAALLVIGWRRLPRTLVAAAPFLLLPLFAVASAGWSDVPIISVRYGAQLFLTVLMGVLLARSLSGRQLVLAVFIGTTIGCLIGLGSGRTGVSEGGPVLIGLAGSKNQMSYICLLWIGSALCVLASARHLILTRLAAALCIAPASFLLLQGDSMTAIVSAILMTALLAVLAVAAWLGNRGRLFALATVIMLAIPAVVAAPQLQEYAQVVRSDVLQKDSRLTGRTLLWESADSLIRQKPLLGHGYKAIWLGSKGAGLLARNDQRDGRAFHFHDTFRELRVDLGIVGLLLFLAPLIFVGLRSIPALIVRVDAPRAFAVVTLLTICLRMRTELIIGPFMIETVLLFAVMAAIAGLPLRRSFEAQAQPRRSSPVWKSRKERKPA